MSSAVHTKDNKKHKGIKVSSITFSDALMGLYIDLQQKDKVYCKRLNTLIKETQRHPTTGLGSPEQLKGTGGNVWSRRVTQKDRLIYRIEGTGVVTVLQIQGHYQDK